VTPVELRHLNYFVAVAEEGSFSGAAERLWVAQPGLSTQIRRLEDELGIKLFERHARGVTLTEGGELFLERGRRAVAAAELARSTGDDLRAGLVGSIKLGAVTGVGWRLLPELLERFGGDRTDVELTVVESYAGTLLRDLQDGRLDAVVAPSLFGSTELSRTAVGGDPWLVLAGPGHRLAGGSGPVAVDELRGSAFVVTGHRDGVAYDRAVAETLTGVGVTPELRRGGSGPALFASVASGEALALTTSSWVAGEGMVARPLHPERRVGFALFGRDEPTPALDEFIKAAKTVGEPARPVPRAVA
jgi:DNA-binding transcriptional LysR family regulator